MEEVKMSGHFGVIAWKVQGGDPLDPLTKLKLKAEEEPRTFWEGTIISVHGMSNTVNQCSSFQNRAKDYRAIQLTIVYKSSLL
ncbi:hypothetical protein OS493_008261 [Desmophyllum pertusum]|uniref:Uncharacterized protein n=1 Tax=Desmophyllum pertusum TaxID=174260 RepID=A0A9X0DBT7_9CNID|nr:hypothetical protein OS493_008261 [Desmophyllum pertusum]